MNFTREDRDKMFAGNCWSRNDVRQLIRDIEELEKELVASRDSRILSDGQERKFLVELSDEVLKTVTETELRDWIKTDEEFDGFHGWKMMGELIPADLSVR